MNLQLHTYSTLLKVMNLEEGGINWEFGIVDTHLEKAMAPHSSTLAWKIPWMEGPGGLQSMGSLGVGHD